MGGSVSVLNLTKQNITVSLWQIGPLNYVNVLEPNCYWKAETGKVWFTLKVWEHDTSKELTGWSVAKPIVLCSIAVPSVTLAAVAAIPVAITVIPAVASATTALSMACAPLVAAGELIAGAVTVTTSVEAAAVGAGCIGLVIADATNYCPKTIPGVYAHGNPKFVVFESFNERTNEKVISVRPATKDDEAMGLFDERNRRL